MNDLKTRPLLALLLFLTAGSARAWGPEGHQAVGRIADALLTEAARSKVNLILRGEALGSLTVTCWADFIRRNKGMEKVYPDNRTWHYIDAPVGAARERLAATPSGNDIIGQLERWRAVLADPEVSPEHKRDALRFLVHFTADAHQPLHCADREGDKGGNLMPVQAFQGEHFSIDAATVTDDAPNLHRTWDEYLVYELMAGADLTNFATGLSTAITPEQVAAWSAGEAADWATETHQRAERCAYRFTDGTPLPLPLTAPAPVFDLTNYIGSNVPVVREQLQKAGVRLAAWINAALAEPGD